MNRMLLASVGLFALLAVQPATAQTPLYNWTGFYFGGNLGFHSGKDDITSTADPVGWTALAPFIDGTYPTTLNPSGLIAGLQGGFNWQAGNVLLGLEADANLLTGSATRTLLYTTTLAGHALFNSTEATFLATVRPRVGIVFDRSLLYVTGGLAIGTIKTTDMLTVPAGNAFAAINATTRTGWTIGGGFEHDLGGNWSMKAEYLYVNLGSFDTVIPSCTPCSPGSDIPVHHTYSDHIVRGGINYRFGGPQ